MKNTIMLLLLLLGAFSSLMAQNYTDTIRISYGNNYYMATHQLSRAELKTLTKQYDESWDYMKKARKNLNATRSLTTIGTVACFIAIGIRGTGNKIAFLVNGIVIGLTGELVFRPKYFSNTMKAVQIYNSKKKEEEEFITFDVSVGFTNNGAGIIIRF